MYYIVVNNMGLFEMFLQDKIKILCRFFYMTEYILYLGLNE